MNTEILPQVVDGQVSTLPMSGMPTITYTRDQVELIKRMYAKDATDDELAAFMYASKRMNLDIIARQIHFTKRQGKPVFIVAIDGYRLNAERTGQYAPGREPLFAYDSAGKVISATAYVKKLIGGEWHEVAATAFMEEYKPSDDSSAFMWKKMPHNQLAKCAEALCLRRAFPKDLGDTITDDEAAQVREPEGRKNIEPPKPKAESSQQAPSSGPIISQPQANRFYAIAKSAGKSDDDINDYLAVKLNIKRSTEMPKAVYESACAWAAEKSEAGDAQE